MIAKYGRGPYGQNRKLSGRVVHQVTTDYGDWDEPASSKRSDSALHEDPDEHGEPRRYELGHEVDGPKGPGTVLEVQTLANGKQRVVVHLEDGSNTFFWTTDLRWSNLTCRQPPRKAHTEVPARSLVETQRKASERAASPISDPLSGESTPQPQPQSVSVAANGPERSAEQAIREQGEKPSSREGWKWQQDNVYAPTTFCSPGEFSLRFVLDAILLEAHERWQALAQSPCAARDEGRCRRECDCRECFRHFFYGDSAPGACCSNGPSCERFRIMHTLVHTATAALHVDLLLDEAVRSRLFAPGEMFAARDCTVASFGCGGAADLVGAAGWLTRHYDDHEASRLILRGCDAADWFGIADMSLARVVGDRSPWRRGVVFEFNLVQRACSESDLLMIDDADVLVFSWVLSVLCQQGVLESFWKRMLEHLRPGALVLVTDRDSDSGFRAEMKRLLDESGQLFVGRGLNEYDQMPDYSPPGVIDQYRPRRKFGAIGVAARVRG